MEIKTIICRTVIEAEGLRSKLMDVGIDSVTYDETNSKVARGILDKSTEVMVREEDYEKAKSVYDEIISEHNNIMPWCPKCGSEHVARLAGQKLNKGRLSMWLSSLLFFFPLSGGLSGRKYRCLDCGKEFEHLDSI